MKVFFNVILAHTFLNAFVLYKGWKVIPHRKSYRIPFIALFIIDLLVYLVGFTFREHLPFDVLRTIMILGTTWAIFILYMSAFILLYDLGKWLFIRISQLIRGRFHKFNPRRVTQSFYLGMALFVVTMMSWGYYKFFHPVINERNITIQKEIAGRDNLRIAIATDIHVGYINDKQVLKKYIDKILEQKADIILFAGDIIDYSLKPLSEQHVETEFQRLTAPLGVYAALGNHDHYADEEEKISWLKEKSGITILQDSLILIDNSFYLVGREDRKSPRKPLEEILSGADKSLPVIVVNHQPNIPEEEVENNVDLAFYGHTHAGQIFPLNLILKMAYELAYGYKQKENTHLFVSSGLGGTPQFRIGTNSEIIVVNLKFSH